MKDSQLQIRVSSGQKQTIKRQARKAGMDVSSWVLSRCLPDDRGKFSEIVGRLAQAIEPSYPLAELNDFLAGLSPQNFAAALVDGLPAQMDLVLANRVAAMAELAAMQKGSPAPLWIRNVAPLPQPVFDSELKSLRIHLLLNSPVPFRRRNIFLDASIGDRV